MIIGYTILAGIAAQLDDMAQSASIAEIVRAEV